MTKLHLTDSAGARRNIADIDEAVPAALLVTEPATPSAGPTPDHWLTAVSADFNIAADWSTGTVPGAGNAAILDAKGKAYKVTASASETVAGIQTAKNATLAVSTGTFTAGGTTNAGKITVANGALFTTQGTVANKGSITLTTATRSAELVISGATSLTGGGKIVLVGNERRGIASGILGAGAPVTLTNVDNTISGAGFVGSGQLTLVNGATGVIDATSVHPLYISTAANGATNNGLMEATNGGILIIEFTTVNGAGGGTILATSGSPVALISAVIAGGTLSSTGGGIIESSDASSVLDGRASAVHNTGTVAVIDSTALTIEGVIANTGQLTFAGPGAQKATLIVGSPGVTLTGGGTVDFGNSFLHYVSGASGNPTLTNVDNTIVGAGDLGNGQIALVNQAGGVIDGTGTSNDLLIDTGPNTITNAGTIEATGAGGTAVRGAVDNTGLLAAAGGDLGFYDAVSGAGSATVNGARLSFFSSFMESVAFTGTSGTLVLGQSRGYTGSVSGFSHTGGTSLDLFDIGFSGPGEATFSGNATSGVLTVFDGTNTSTINLIGDYTNATFTAASDNHGGVIITDTPKSAAIAPPYQFVAAMANLGADNAAAVHATAHSFHTAAMFLTPRTRIA